MKKIFIHRYLIHQLFCLLWLDAQSVFVLCLRYEFSKLVVFFPLIDRTISYPKSPKMTLFMHNCAKFNLYLTIASMQTYIHEASDHMNLKYISHIFM